MMRDSFRYIDRDYIVKFRWDGVTMGVLKGQWTKISSSQTALCDGSSSGTAVCIVFGVPF